MEQGRRFDSHIAVVTGAGNGIGRATALRLAGEGARVAAWDINGAGVEATAGMAAEGQVTAYVVDVSDRAQVSAAAVAVKSDLGRVSVLHNNAGILRAGSVLDHDLDEWDHIFATNVTSMVLVSREFLPGMLERGAGAVVNTGSVSGMIGDEGLAGYDATKGAIIQLTRQMAADFSGRGVRTNCVCPGWVKTGFNDPQFEADPSLDEEALVRASTPMQRQATPDEIAAAVCFLASEDASYITGHALVVDGGLSIT